MGNQESKNDYDESLDQRNWRKVMGQNGKEQYQNIQNRQFWVEEYYISIDDQQELQDYKSMFQSRKNSKDLIATHHMSINEGKQVCSSKANGHLYLQKIPITLSNITDIPFPDVLHVYDQCLNGFNKIKSTYGYCSIYQDCIGINDKNIVKVWHSHQYDKLYPTSRTQNQENMVKSILSIIQSNTNIKTMPIQQPSIMNFIGRQNAYNFRQAKTKIYQYAYKYNNSVIPSSLQCAQKVGGSQEIKNNLALNNKDQLFTTNNFSQAGIPIFNQNKKIKSNSTSRVIYNQQQKLGSPRIPPVKQYEQDRNAKSQLYIGPPSTFNHQQQIQHQQYQRQQQQILQQSPQILRPLSITQKQKSTIINNNTEILNNSGVSFSRKQIKTNNSINDNNRIINNSLNNANIRQQVMLNRQQQLWRTAPVKQIQQQINFERIPNQKIVNNSQFHKLQRRVHVVPDIKNNIQIKNVEMIRPQPKRVQIMRSQPGRMEIKSNLITQVKQIPINRVQVLKQQPNTPSNNRQNMPVYTFNKIPSPSQVMQKTDIVRHQKLQHNPIQSVPVNKNNNLPQNRRLSGIKTQLSYQQQNQLNNYRTLQSKYYYANMNNIDETPSQLLQRLLRNSPVKKQFSCSYQPIKAYQQIIHQPIYKSNTNYVQYDYDTNYKQNSYNQYVKQSKQQSSNQIQQQSSNQNRQQLVANYKQHNNKIQVKPIITQLLDMKQSVMSDQYNVKWDPQILADLETHLYKCSQSQLKPR